MIYALYGTLAILALVGLVCWIADNDKPLPKPSHDERDWQGAFMKDWKR